MEHLCGGVVTVNIAVCSINFCLLVCVKSSMYFFNGGSRSLTAGVFLLLVGFLSGGDGDRAGCDGATGGFGNEKLDV